MAFSFNALRYSPCPLFQTLPIWIALTVGVALAQPSDSVDTKACATCHPQIYASYQHTGMARSFYPADDASIAGGLVSDFYHAPSDTHYSMLPRDGHWYQRRWQIGPSGQQINAEEMQVDFVIGSGNHARTYLHRTARGTLIQLPLGWYAEKGGYWAMNPGYDSPRLPSHRAISYECMSCHNSYPKIPPGHDDTDGEPLYVGALPAGIDCQRCHGPAARHLQAVRKANPTRTEIRASIVNPARLSKDRQMEVCLQCHLETTSAPLPSLVRRFDKGPFAYLPGQPLGNFILSFDQAPGHGQENRFEIAGSAYRFRQSQCFLKSRGEMTCETCHNPHNIPRGAEATTYYVSICAQCHSDTITRLKAAGKHPVGADCVSCHMPKRRTDDAVHVVMTDHLILRRPYGDLLADRPEIHLAPKDEYRGKVVRYYTATPTVQPEDALYLALAQVQQRTNLAGGIADLQTQLSRKPAPRADFYLALGEALRQTGQVPKAAAAYQTAVKLRPHSAREVRSLGTTLKDLGQNARAREMLETAARLAPNDAATWFDLGLLESEEGHAQQALQALKKAGTLNPDLPGLWNNVAVTSAASGDSQRAAEAFQKALEIDPYDGTAQSNFGRLLAEQGKSEDALYHFAKAAALQPQDAMNLYEWSLLLAQMERFDDSQKQGEAAIQADPKQAEAHELLGSLLARKNDLPAAIREYREAVRLKPDFSRAQLDLAAALVASGHPNEALGPLREAAKSSDPRIAGSAARALQRITGEH